MSFTKEEWRENYIGAFNRGDFSFTDFYEDDVVLHLGQKAVIHGKQGIIDFYTKVFERVRETLEVDKIVLDDEGLGCIVRTEFKALEDCPDFIAGAMRKGESIFIESFIFYTIGANGKFTQIRTTRSKG
jgi:hypothetical protein